MSYKTVTFAARPELDSKGRNGFIITTGVEVSLLGNDQHPSGGTIMIRPLTSRGDVGGSCRVCIPRTALPDVLEALKSLELE